MSWTKDDIPALDGKTAIVTGATSGLGFETARSLALAGAHVVLGVRDEGKGRRSISQIQASNPSARVTTLPLDLTSLASIERFSQAFQSAFGKLHILINNAGVGSADEDLTQDGFPRIMGVNHLAHFALTGSLIHRLLAIQHARIVTVTSQVYKNSSIDLNGLRTPNANSYGSSKLANLLFSFELQRRLSKLSTTVISLAAHPGAGRTEGVEQLLRQSSNPLFKIAFGFFVRRVMQSAEMGALNALRAATDPKATGGELYGPNGFLSLRGHPEASFPNLDKRLREMARELWRRSLDLTAVRYEALNKD
ncbi:MAG: oxidoreductase [Pseudomonadota bacterium]